MSSATVVLDQIVAPVPGGIGRYALNLIRALTARTDHPRTLTGFVPRVPRDTVMRLHSLMPLLGDIEVSPLTRPVLARAWRIGAAVPKRNLTYSPSLFAPLVEHGKHIVTIHDAVPWTHPKTLTRNGAAWHRAMGERAARFADIIVVPTEAVAARLSDFLSFGDRVRVIGGAPSTDLVVPSDSVARRAALKLPEVFVTFVGTLEPRKGIAQLIAALAAVENLSLVVVGPRGWGGIDVATLVEKSGIDASRVHALGRLDDADLAAVLSASRALVVPSIDEGFGLPVLEAMSLGVPVIHSTAAALVEVAGGAALSVDVHGRNGITELAEALTGMSEDELRRDLISRGRARSAQFSWDANAAALATIIDELS
jgi:glycosyltransferase involved in cell wall biosynthesis